MQDYIDLLTSLFLYLLVVGLTLASVYLLLGLV